MTEQTLKSADIIAEIVVVLTDSLLTSINYIL